MSFIKCDLDYFCLDNVFIFNLLDKFQKENVHSLVKSKYFKAGETIYVPGKKASDLYIVSSGKIRLFRLSENGREQLLRIIIPGEFTGELALFKEGLYEAFAEVLEDTYVCTISHYDFKQLIITYPNIAIKMLEVLASRLSYSEEQTAWISTLTVKDRIIHYLTKTSYYLNNQVLVNLNIPKKDLASYLGTSPESLSREFTKLEEEQIIKYLIKNVIMLNTLNTIKIG